MNTSYKGLVLAGGQSMRMGTDKAVLKINNKEQWLKCAELLSAFCSDIFVAQNPQQTWPVTYPFQSLIDLEQAPGPFHPWSRLHNISRDSSWIIATCDLAFLNIPTIEKLHRSAESGTRSSEAFCFLSSDGSFPDPQIAILKPDATAKAAKAYQNGIRSPRKFLQQINTASISKDDPDCLFSTNTPEEFRFAQQTLSCGN